MVFKAFHKPVAGRALGASAMLVAMLTWSGCSLILDFSAAEEVDAAVVFDAGIDAFMPSIEQCAAFEPNNDEMSASMVQYPIEAALCGLGDEGDFFALNVPANDANVRISLTFPHLDGNGDLKLELLDPLGIAAGILPVEADTMSDDEEISIPATPNPLPAGDYVIKIGASPNSPSAQTVYTLDVAL